jgi:hypothetical protein
MIGWFRHCAEVRYDEQTCGREAKLFEQREPEAPRQPLLKRLFGK